MFKRKEKEIPTSEEVEEIGMIIHFTPSATCIYISKEGVISSDIDSSSISMKDMEGRYIEINGTYIVLEVYSISEIQTQIEKYRLETLGLPIIQIEVNEL